MPLLKRSGWDAKWEAAIGRLHWNDGLPWPQARETGRELTEKRYGPRPEDEPGGGLKAAILRLTGRLLMPEGVKTFVNRWAVLISVVYLSAVAVLQALAERGCEACSMFSGVLKTVFGLLALTPDPAIATEVTVGVAGGLALYGATRKIYSLATKRLAKVQPALKS